jgi:ABC-type multidrug transport system fused ATPase/permease subunit
VKIRNKIITCIRQEQLRRLLAGVLLALGQIIFLLILPWLFKLAVSGIASRSWLYLAGIGMLILVVQLLASGLSLGARWQTLNATKEIIRQLRDDLIRTLLFTSHQRYSGLDRAFVHTRIIDDTERLDVMLNAVAVNLLPAAIASLGLVVLLFSLSCKLALLLFVTIPLFLLLTRRVRKQLRHRVKDFNDSFEEFSRGIRFLLEMYELTLHQNAREKELEKQLTATRRLQGSSRSMALMSTFYTMSQEFVVIIAMVIVLLGGGWFVRQGNLQLGELASFCIAVLILKNQLRTFATALPQVVIGWESLKRLEELEELEGDPFYRGKKQIIFRGEIKGRNLTFAYSGKPPILNNFSFTIQPGTITGLQGPNGSGKTTLLNLIYGIHHPREGELLADSIPYSELDLDNLRRQLALVPQNPLFFDGTIQENLLYGLDETEPERVTEILNWTTAGEWIGKLAEGLDTRIGESGLELSGGQRQALAICRALLHRPKLILLDEPTNHLDPEVMARLLTKLAREKSSTGILVASHDPRVLEHCDRIIPLQQAENG